MSQFLEIYNELTARINRPPDTRRGQLFRRSNIARNPEDPTAPYVVKHSDGYEEPISGDGLSTLLFPIVQLHFEIDYTDFQPNATASGSIALGTLSIPAGGIITMIKTKHSVIWTGAGVTAALLRIRDSTGITYLGDTLTKYNMSVPVAPTVGAFYTGTSNLVVGDGIPSHTTATDLIAALTITGGGSIDDLVSGVTDIWVEMRVVL